jgi:prepilin-type processing-associated H-X9-DG protein
MIVDSRPRRRVLKGLSTATYLNAVLVCVIAVFLGLAMLPIHTDTGNIPKSPCMANLKELGIGMQMYTADYDDRMPDCRKWMDVLNAYTGRDDLARCPSVAPNGSDAYGYAMNAALSGKRASETPILESTPSLFDSTLLSRNAYGSLATLPDPPRHNGANNVGFADGHVKRLTPQEAAVIQTAARRCRGTHRAHHGTLPDKR